MRYFLIILLFFTYNTIFSQSATFSWKDPTCNTNFHNGSLTITVTGLENSNVTYNLLNTDINPPVILTSGPVTDSVYTFTGLANNTFAAYANVNVNGTTQAIGFASNKLENTPYFAVTSKIKGAGCEGQHVGIVDVNVIGGIAPYSYSWDNGSSDVFADTNKITNVRPADYTVTVTDDIGCEIISSSTTIAPEDVIISKTINNHVLCKGMSTGKVTASAKNTTGPVVFEWSDAFVGQIHSNLSAGDYTVIAIDSIGCTDTATFSITEPLNKIVLSLVNKEDLLCTNIPTGKAFFSTEHGNAPLAYEWSDGGSGSSREDLLADSYRVIVIDKTQCKDSVDFSLTQPATHIQGSLDNFTQPLCYGDANGTAEISASGGTGSYIFTWNDPDNDSTKNDASRTDLKSMLYTITFIDDNNCVDSLLFDLQQPDSLIASIVSLDDSPALSSVLCYNDKNIDLKVAVTGGTEPFASFIWDTTGIPNNDIIQVGAGVFQVEVTDANNCKARASHTITEPPLLENSINILTEILCNGGSGRIGSTPTGGTTPYTYEWSHGITEWNSGLVTTGTYTSIVTDNNGCVDEKSILLPEPDSIKLEFTITADVCNDVSHGNLWVTATGGTVSSSYSYMWSTGETTDTITNLLPQEYSVTVTDDNGCSVSKSIDLSTINDFAISFEMSQVICPGQSNGAVTVNPINGTAPYTYEWSNGMTTQTISDVPAGDYAITVYDVNGCPVSGNISVTTKPSMYIQNFGTTPTPCNEQEGSAFIEVASGASPYTYLWSNGETTDSITNLQVDYYTVLITDDNGCTLSKQLEVSDTSSLTVSAFSDNIKIRCAGRADGEATALATLGTPPYTYEWSNGETTQDVSNLVAGLYYIYARDAYNCVALDSIRFVEEDVLRAHIFDSAMISCHGKNNGWAIAQAEGGVGPYYSVTWDNGETTNLISKLSPGTYVATMTDANSCSVTTQIVITEPLALSSTIDNTTSVSCGGICDAKARVIVNGGTEPYTYQWSSIDVDSAASNLCAGWQYVTITDAFGCSLIDSVNIVDTIPVITITSNMVEPDCMVASGKIDVSAAGGFAPYTYEWSTGATTALIENVLPSVYSLTVTDSKGCSLDTLLVLNDNSNLAIDTIIRQSITFCDSCNESYRVIASGGTTPYSYLWSNGDTGAVADSLCTNVYAVTVTDANECKRSQVISVVEKPLAIDLVQKTDVICHGANTGELEVVAKNGVSSNYTYSWSNGETTAKIQDLHAGEYTVTVIEDSSVCAAQKTFEVTQNDELKRFFITDMPSYCKDSTGQMHVEILNGVEPISYAWEDGTLSSTLTNAYPEYIGIIITDGNGCIVKDSAKVDDVSNFSLFEKQRGLISCIGDSDGTLEVGTNNGYAPFTYSWQHETTLNEPTATNLAQGVYTVSVKDSRNCLVSYEFSKLTNPDTMKFEFTEIHSIYCFGETGDVRAYVSGGHPGYNFTWTLDSIEQASTSLDIKNIPTGTLHVHVRDSRGCESDTVSYFLSEPPQITASFTVTETGCSSQSHTGEIRVDTIIGSNPPYKFSWHDAPTNFTFYDGTTNITKSGLAAGSYVFRIEDSLGICSNEFTNYTYPLVVESINTGITHTHCGFYTNQELETNTADGKIIVTHIVTKKGDYLDNSNFDTISDFSAYSILWNDSKNQNTSTASNLIAGEYTVSFTHTNGCENTFVAGSVDPLVSLSTRISKAGEPLFDMGSICLGDSIRLEAHANAIYSHGYVPANESVTYTWESIADNIHSSLSQKTNNYIWAKPLSKYYADKSLIQVQYLLDGCSSPISDFEISHYDSLDFKIEVVDVFDNYVGEDSVFAIKNEAFLINPIPTPWYVYKSADEDGIVSIAWESLDKTKEKQGQIPDTITNEAKYVESGYYGLYIPAKTPTYYYATATTTHGCIEKAHVMVNVYENSFTPNVLTPNGDGYNDTWVIPYLHMCPDAKVTIYNRWGVKVFENSSTYFENPWDGTNKNGKLLPVSSYYYLIEYNDKHNTPPKAGTISILY